MTPDIIISQQNGIKCLPHLYSPSDVTIGSHACSVKNIAQNPDGSCVVETTILWRQVAALNDPFGRVAKHLAGDADFL